LTKEEEFKKIWKGSCREACLHKHSSKGKNKKGIKRKRENRYEKKKMSCRAKEKKKQATAAHQQFCHQSINISRKYTQTILNKLFLPNKAGPPKNHLH